MSFPTESLSSPIIIPCETATLSHIEIHTAKTLGLQKAYIDSFILENGRDGLDLEGIASPIDDNQDGFQNIHAIAYDGWRIRSHMAFGWFEFPFGTLREDQWRRMVQIRGIVSAPQKRKISSTVLQTVLGNIWGSKKYSENVSNLMLNEQVCDEFITDEERANEILEWPIFLLEGTNLSFANAMARVMIESGCRYNSDAVQRATGSDYQVIIQKHELGSTIVFSNGVGTSERISQKHAQVPIRQTSYEQYSLPLGAFDAAVKIVREIPKGNVEPKRDTPTGYGFVGLSPELYAVIAGSLRKEIIKDSKQINKNDVERRFVLERI